MLGDTGLMGSWSVVDILQIVFADIVLSGDNALVIGMAAASLSPTLRRRAIFLGMMAAAIMRIIFAVIASYLLAIKGILLIGGVLLAWVCWRFYSDLQEFNAHESSPDEEQASPDEDTSEHNSTFWRALVTILIADISMSIDNIVAVAAIARENTQLLIFGLALAIAFFASLIMQVMVRFRWLSYLGLAFLVYLAAMMLYDGLAELGVTASLIL